LLGEDLDKSRQWDMKNYGVLWKDLPEINKLKYKDMASKGIL
jgi:hypothetical protein